MLDVDKIEVFVEFDGIFLICFVSDPLIAIRKATLILWKYN